MATITKRTISRKTADVDACFRRKICVRVEPDSKCLILWTLGSRTKYHVRYQDIFRLGYLAFSRKLLEEKRKGRKRTPRV